MKGVFAAATAALCAIASAKELPVDMARKAELYDSGIRHQQIMDRKNAVWNELDAAGVFDSSQYKHFDKKKSYVPCKDGYASYIAGDPKYTFKCNNLDLYDFKTHLELGSPRGRGAGSWGWTSSRGREFVAIAQEDGVAFAEVSKKGKLIYLGRLPHYTGTDFSRWREIKGYKSQIVIGSEAVGHGVQIFDMAKLQFVDPEEPVIFTNEKDLTAWWGADLPVGRSHNVVTNEERHYGVAVGFQPRNGTLRAGMLFFDLKDPKNPKTLGGTGIDGYVHDAQCIVYRGPDRRYLGRDICYGYDEDSLAIFDVSNKQNVKLISNTSYEGAAYTHQGWVLDPKWQEFLILDDEWDEVDKVGPGEDQRPVSYIWDISDLRKPKQTGIYKNARKGIDHNQFVVDGFAWQSNYGLGINVLDLRSVPRDPTGKSIREVASFDTFPEDDNLPGGGNVTYTGSWSHYPFFKSGFVVINTIDRGAFVVKKSKGPRW